MQPIERQNIALFSPSNFAMVMATGIVSIAAHNFNLHLLADGLFYLNNLLYVLVWVLTIIRLLKYPKVFWGDLYKHATGLSFLALVAATNVLGVQYITMYQNYTVGFVLWVVGVVFWLLITYTVFTILIVKVKKPTLAIGINGAWLLEIDVTQSISLLRPYIPSHTDHSMLF